MANVTPFQGLRYAPGLKPNLHRLLTPPYDIISPRDQERFYRSHAHNIIRLEYGRTKTTDSDHDNRYSRAAKVLNQWLEQGVLLQDAKPAMYILKTDYRDPWGRAKTFTGLIARVQLETFDRGVVLPHEKTYAGPKADRLNLLQATGVSFSPVFSLYRDPDRKVTSLLEQWTRRQPAVDVRDWSGCRQRMWSLVSPSVLASLQQAFRSKKLLIADGHHRYATALAYRDWLGPEAGEAAKSVMMCLAETQAPGLTVLPVCRLIRDVNTAGWKRFQDGLSELFDVIPVKDPAHLQEVQQTEARASRQAVIGYMGRRAKTIALLRVNTAGLDWLRRAAAEGHSPLYNRLDVVILNLLILDRLLGIKPGEEAGRVAYTKDPADALARVKAGEVQGGFWPGLPNLGAIWDLAKRGETMPQKSTYFLPKLITGLVLNPIRLTR